MYTETYFFSVLDGTDSTPKLNPYPNYETNDISTGNYDDKLVSVFGVRVDEHDRLWFVDCGLNEIRDRGIQLASPKLHVYDLKTDTLINTVVLSSHSKVRSIFIDLAVDTDPKDSENTFVYIADTRTFAIIVYNLKTNELHRIENNYFHIDSRYGNFVYKGIRYQWPDGITGLTISHMYPDGYKTMFFHSLASLSEYAVSTETLQDKSQSSNFSKYIHLGDRGESGQSSAESLDIVSGVIFFTQVQKNSIGCWNSFTSHEYTDTTIGTVADGLEYPNHLTIDLNRNIWILENDLVKFLYAIKSRVFSYKISRIPVNEAIQGTVCFSDNTS